MVSGASNCMMVMRLSGGDGIRQPSKLPVTTAVAMTARHAALPHAILSATSQFLMEAPTHPLSSRLERTRISCCAAFRNGHVCGFLQGKPHEDCQRHQVRQEIRGSAREG